MAKHPEKFIKEKEIHKEFIKDKLEKEHKDHKEKPEKLEIKEIKELHKEVKESKPEKEIKELAKETKPEKEFKEGAKEKEVKEQKDIKEVKEIEKQDKEKDKDAEGGPIGGGDPILRQQAAAAAQFKFKDHLEKIHVEKVHKDKDHEFAVHAAAAAQPQAQAAQAKLTDKILEKTHKDIEKIIKDKDFKTEKHEFKEWKDVREFVAGPGVVGPGDPVEQRLAALEATLGQLLHFIPQELRPDLSTGALSAEKKGQAATPAKQSKKAAGANKAKTEKK